jgi:hypothetical protein
MATQSGQHFVHGGDVQMLETSVPTGAKKISHKPLALGEKSGHMHIATGDVELFEDELSNVYVVVGPKGALLQHVHESNFNGDYTNNNVISRADHKPVVLKPNTTYKSGIHKRYNPLAKHWESVKD